MSSRSAAHRAYIRATVYYVLVLFDISVCTTARVGTSRGCNLDTATCTDKSHSPLKSSDYFPHNQVSLSEILLSAHSACLCFVWISEHWKTISLHCINWLVSMTETECVYCAVRAGHCDIIQDKFRLYRLLRIDNNVPFILKNLINVTSYIHTFLNRSCFILWRCGPTRARASSFLRFLDHTERRTTVGRTPLDEWSARRRDLYLTTHNTHNRQISMPPVGFEPTISAGERPQTYALDRTATGTGKQIIY